MSAVAYRTVAIYAIVFVGVLLYFGVYRKEWPGTLLVVTAVLLAGAGALKIWLVDQVKRRTVDEPYIQKAVDLGLDVVLLVLFGGLYMAIGRFS